VVLKKWLIHQHAIPPFSLGTPPQTLSLRDIKITIYWMEEHESYDAWQPLRSAQEKCPHPRQGLPPARDRIPRTHVDFAFLAPICDDKCGHQAKEVAQFLRRNRRLEIGGGAGVVITVPVVDPKARNGLKSADMLSNALKPGVSNSANVGGSSELTAVTADSGCGGYSTFCFAGSSIFGFGGVYSGS
jgi:hypothetical protein